MNLTKLSDEVLLLQAKSIAAQERDALTRILHHLREIEARRLYTDLKYHSLFDYAVHELKYSEGQASRRVQAMRLMAAIPEVESQIASGELSISNVAMVQTAFIKSGRKLNRRDVLKKIEGMSTRQALEVVGVPKKELTLNMIGDEALREKGKRILGKYAHSKLSLEDILHLLFDLELAAPHGHLTSRKPVGLVKAVKPAKEFASPFKVVRRNATPAPESALSLATNRKRLMDTVDACSRCGSYYALEVDHIVPRGKGGLDDPENLRVLCRACNQRLGILSFGRLKMAEFISV